MLEIERVTLRGYPPKGENAEDYVHHQTSRESFHHELFEDSESDSTCDLWSVSLCPKMRVG